MTAEVSELLEQLKGNNLIVASVPIFFILIGVELLIDRLKKSGFYRLNDGVTNISCGIGSQVTGIFLKFVTVVLYVWLFTKSPFKGQIPNTWYVWIVLFVAIDFAYYWFHRLAHEINVLWGSHVVHHQSEEYNLTVALRQSWVQGAFSSWFYLPLAFLGFDPVMFVTINALQTLYQFWIHTKFIDKMPAWFELVFNTPSHHRVHHGVNPKYIDRNHGGTLIIFDRLFGTFQAEEEDVVYGITKQPKSWNPLWLNLEHWTDMARDFVQLRTWKDRLKLLFGAPGWRPEYLGGPVALKEVSTTTFHKYNPQIPAGLTSYVIFQFGVLLAGTAVFLNVAGNFDWGWKWALSSLIVYSVVNIGALLEHKNWVLWLEFLRIIALAGIMVILAGDADWAIYLRIAMVFYILLSVTWIGSMRGALTPSENSTANE